jgi:adenosylhomocysteine nucleosidase
MIAIFAAMESEVQPLLQGATVGGRKDVGGFPVTPVSYGGIGAIICRTGIGRSAGEATAAVLQHYSPAAAISIGVAGGLSPLLHEGDIVLCDPVSVSASSGYCDVDGSLSPHQKLVTAARSEAEKAGLRVSVGGSLTVDRVVAAASEKNRLRELLGHDVVEMESYWIGKTAEDMGVPFLAVRVVSDEAGDSLPDIDFGNSDGTANYALMAAWAQRNPDSVKLLAKIAGRSQTGSAAIARFSSVFFQSSVWDTVLSHRLSDPVR